MYFRASGAELGVEPAAGEARYRARLYAERQAAVVGHTDFSLRRVVNDGHRFRPNIEADPATQVGASLLVGRDRGLDPTGARWGAWLDLTAETGTFSFVRPGLTLMGGLPLPGRLVAAAEVGVGTTMGAASETGSVAPVQSLWFLGGPTTLRGFAPGTFSGPDHVRARAELASRFPAARVVLFSDAGWAGAFDEYLGDDLAVSAGVGASVLDGLLRLDVARTLRPTRRWRLELYVDALF
jgi:hypothetical protein